MKKDKSNSCYDCYFMRRMHGNATCNHPEKATSLLPLGYVDASYAKSNECWAWKKYPMFIRSWLDMLRNRGMD